MPLPTDPEVVQTSGDLVKQLQTLFGKHPGSRPAHAKGILLTGTFTPTPAASTLSRAPHFTQPSTPLLIRFSNSTGIPDISDISPDADPRGIAIRFVLGDRKHTDIVAHSTPFFPTRTGAEFLQFLKAAGASGPDAEHPTPIEQFLGANPKALDFVKAEKKMKVSYGREEYFSVSAFKFVDKEGKERYVRYRIVPTEGVEVASEEAKKGWGVDYLQEEIKERLSKGKIEFTLQVQVAGEGDTVDDATVHWPEEREVVKLGTVSIEGVKEGGEKESKTIIFDPIPRVDGVDVSADPLLEVRAGVYLISGRERRAA
ncbi:catalase protein [Rutstroemia sp. NJR-2017a BBW]|nr:catalase protein [Rutstroemia sp. NJR-2017a BBW]